MDESGTQSAKRAVESAATKALRAVDEVRSLLDAATPEDLAERAATVKRKLDTSREALERATSEAEGVFSRVLVGAEGGFREEFAEVEQRIRENPLGALIAAAGMGLLLGLALSRHR